MSESWTVRRILAWTTEHFDKAGVPSAKLNAEILLADVLKLKARLDLLLEPERELTGAERDTYREFVKRRASREPTAHILGCWAFYKRDFALTSDVLTPRSETELVADRAIAWARENDAKSAVDIGTGCGCLAVTLAVELPHLCVVATDLSPQALEVARRNAEKHEVADRLQFLEADLLPEPGTRSAAPGRSGGEEGEPGTADLIVSNPPYIETGRIGSLMPEVAKHEPRLALDGGEDGLEFYRRLAPEVARHLRSGGAAILEIGDDQGRAVSEIFEAAGEYRDIDFSEDLNGLDRVFFARKA